MSEKEQYTIFRKYTRRWLHEKTGFSTGYLSRVSTGRARLTRSFMDRCCFRLGESREELFGKERR